MAIKKKSGGTAARESNLLEKIGGQAIHLKDEIIAGTDHLLEAAGEKFAAVKKSIESYVGKKKIEVTKTANKPARKKTNNPSKKIPHKVAVKKSAVKKAPKKVGSVPEKKTVKVKASTKKASKKRSKDDRPKRP